MALMRIEETQFPELAWLAEVQEVARPLSEACPIWVRHERLTEGPSIPHPERHPYCEMNFMLHGRATHYSQRMNVARQPGDLFLAGPGVPHFSHIERYPLETITVYFLPSLLLEMGPSRDGGQLLHTIVNGNSSSGNFVRPTAPLRRQFARGFSELLTEFSRPQLGSELRMRALLADLLVRLARSELVVGDVAATQSLDQSWRQAERALHYLREHFAETIYARDVAEAAGVSESALRKVFRDSVGMPWVQYLQGYRIHRAAAILLEPGRTVTDAALTVGFEDLSHFISAFRAYMGVSPGAYGKKPTL